MKILTAYFSAEGTTKAYAGSLAQAIGADLFEIAPREPYSKADINWKNPLSRCNREKIGKKDVPVREQVGNWEEYDLVFLGFPIWYYGAPNIVHTFCRQYDWTGKKVFLFATSGGSGIGKTAEKLMPSLSGNPEVIGAGVYTDPAQLTADAEKVL